MTSSMVMAIGRNGVAHRNGAAQGDARGRLTRGFASQRDGLSRTRRHGGVLAVLLTLTLAFAGVGMLTAEPARSDGGAMQVTSYIVRPGDTLWSYASAITPTGHDVSETVAELISLNNLESGALRAGQRSIVPVE